MLAVPVGEDWGKNFEERFSLRLLQAYGMTECNIPAYSNLEDPVIAGCAGRIEDDFFETLKTDADHFEKLVSDAAAEGKRLKYVAELDNGKANVGLQAVPQGHPFYNLEGKDNIVLFFTDRYPEQPLIVKGAGAGGDVTASGLFSDVMRTRNM